MAGDRLSALDATFLHLEDAGPAHMHVASVLVFDGEPPPYDELLEHLERRLHLVPRYRQRLAHVPLGQGRPIWVDDPHFNLGYHLRHAALPAPGSEEELRRLAGRIFSQRLDRAKPLWEVWLVEGLSPTADGGARFALVAKTHHALVDGVSGVDIVTVLFDTSPDPAPVPAPERDWQPAPEPSGAQLLADALIERAIQPTHAARQLVQAPTRALQRLAGDVRSLGALGAAGLRPAPESPLNVPIGSHRRYTWATADLGELKQVKDALGGTVNDVVLTMVAGALRRFLLRRGHDVDGLELVAFVPVSVRADAERGALGNRVAAMYAPLPVGVGDPVEALARVRETMGDLKESGQAVGARRLTELADFAPPTILSQAARLQRRQRGFNLVVTNVPGPQFPLYVRGRRLASFLPAVPLADGQALGLAAMSYDGKVFFGLLADFDALPDVEELAGDLGAALAGLLSAASGAGRRRAAAGRRS